jgi:hypothetical protein
MKSICRSHLVAALASLFIAASDARAALVLSTLDKPQKSLSSIGVPWLGQRFVTGPSSEWLLNSVSVTLYDTQDSTSPLFVSIYGNLGTNTPSAELGRFLTGNFAPTTGGTYTYSGYNGGFLAPSSSYWLVLGVDIEDAEDSTLYLWWDTDSTSYLSQDSWLIPETRNSAFSFVGTGWAVFDETPFLFSVEATPIPEPGTWAAAALLAGGAAFMRWRRRCDEASKQAP